MNIHQLRDLVGKEIIDFNELKAALVNYEHPRGKISKWLAKGDLVRVKKGLYVFGESVSRGPFSMLQLANLIYGPSAISLEYALAFYGLIPEAVHTLTSITNKRNKQFTTPAGRFTYSYLSKDKYPVGIQLLNVGNANILFATPEKALCDYITLACSNVKFKTSEDVQQFLFDDLRIDENLLFKMDKKLLSEIVKTYNVKRLNDFYHYFLEENI